MVGGHFAHGTLAIESRAEGRLCHVFKLRVDSGRHFFGKAVPLCTVGSAK